VRGALIAGIDENGLGPRLGPLVATAVVVGVPHYDRAAILRTARSVGIDDSKATSAFGDMARAESIALALVERLSGVTPADADSFLAEVSLSGALALRARCAAADHRARVAAPGPPTPDTRSRALSGLMLR
jgi:ribonuclease HII